MLRDRQVEPLSPDAVEVAIATAARLGDDQAAAVRGLGCWRAGVAGVDLPGRLRQDHHPRHRGRGGPAGRAAGAGVVDDQPGRRAAPPSQHPRHHSRPLRPRRMPARGGVCGDRRRVLPAADPRGRHRARRGRRLPGRAGVDGRRPPPSAARRGRRTRRLASRADPASGACRRSSWS